MNVSQPRPKRCRVVDTTITIKMKQKKENKFYFKTNTILWIDRASTCTFCTCS